MDTKTIQICALSTYSSAEEFLHELKSVSSSKLKKHFLKTFLNNPLKKGALVNLPLDFANEGMINPSYEGESLKIIDENEYFFVFSKMPNQHIHPLIYCEGDNCLSWMRQKHWKLLEVNEEAYDRGLLYRLDYETSGVVIYAKSNEVYREIRENFKEMAREKIYHCWVSGKFNKEGKHTHSFSSKGAKGHKVVVAAKGDYEINGELSVRLLNFDENLNQSLLEVTLYSGLRHQIRAQLAYLGFPLVGDELYGGVKSERLYLHALKYTLSYLGKAYSWTDEPRSFKPL